MGRQLLALVLVAALVGCSSYGPAAERVDKESLASIKAYAANMKTAVAGLLEWGVAAELRGLRAETELAIAEEVAEVEVLDQVVEDEEGVIVEVKTRLMSYIAPAVAKAAAALAMEQAKGIFDAVAGFREDVAGAEGDLHDALMLRSELARVLRAGGMDDPEQIEALSEALARELARR